jgi:hypothetical protein
MKTYGEVEEHCHPSWPRHYMEISDQFHGPAALLPGKVHPVPIWQQPGRAPQPVWALWTRDKSYHRREPCPAVQPEVCRYTDWAIPALKPRVAPVGSRRQAQKAKRFSYWFLAWLTPRPWRWKQYVCQKRKWTSTRLHGVTSQKTLLFIIKEFGYVDGYVLVPAFQTTYFTRR